MRSKTVQKTEAQKKFAALPVTDYYAGRILDELRLILNQSNINHICNRYGIRDEPALFLVCALDAYRTRTEDFLKGEFDCGDQLLGLS